MLLWGAFSWLLYTLLSPDHAHSFLGVLSACAGLVGDLVPLPGYSKVLVNWGSPEWQPLLQIWRLQKVITGPETLQLRCQVQASMFPVMCQPSPSIGFSMTMFLYAPASRYVPGALWLLFLVLSGSSFFSPVPGPSLSCLQQSQHLPLLLE